jgi:hypothetical protein
VTVVVLDADVASGLLRRRLAEPIGCLVRELPLATFNTKDFVDFAEHEGPRLLS